MPNVAPTYFEIELDRLYGKGNLRPEPYAQVRQSRLFMEQHFTDPVELDDLARAACMSRFHYVRMFRRVYGITPRAYLRDLRISRAKCLIRCGMSITQVCLEVGYTSAPTFSTQFRKCAGVTPSVYQRQHLSNPE